MSAFHDAEIYRSLLESLPTGLCVVDVEKKIVLWSDGAERITGHLRHEVIGHCCIGEALLHCDQQDCEWCNEDCPLARAMKTAHATEAIGFLHHKAGHEVLVHVRAVPVWNAHGSIIGAVETFEDQQQAAFDQPADHPRVAACMDEATGVANHAMMQSHLRETLGAFSDVQVPFGVLCIRLDDLTDLRAHYGLEAASSLLRMIGRTLASSLWKTDLVGRWSDDQFLVIVHGCSEDALRTVGERVRRMLASNGIEWWGERLSFAVSIGRAGAQPGDTVDSLMGRAEKSLDAASSPRARAASGGQSSGSNGS